jgi:RNA polymerase sigma-70 factor, ECF subfamily
LTEELTQELAEARRRFDEACDRLRPDLHRFCTRMTGGPCDGEDVLQDTLALAFYRLAELRATTSLRSWLFRIAHNKCVDFLRARRRVEPFDEESDAEEDRPMDEKLEDKRRAERALSNIVTELPPKERACIVLKDILDCSLEETAEITESNVGAVKAALHRGREKLNQAERMRDLQSRSVPIEPRRRALVERYIAAFNQQDWAGVRALLSDEARLEVVHRSEGPFSDSCYFDNHLRLSWQWKLGLAWVDGVQSVVRYRQVDGEWVPQSVVQLAIEDDRVTLVRDYIHVEYLLHHCTVTPSRD